MTILNTRGHLRQRDNAADSWNPPGLPAEWLVNPHDNPRRADWINSLQHFSRIEPGQRGVKALGENGKWRIART